MIRQDRIDILVDLAVHTSKHRLLVLRKPAPIQATFLGYWVAAQVWTPSTTGCPILISDPPDADTPYAEQTIRLPCTYRCYRPTETTPPTDPPAVANGFITFGSLNGYAKSTLASQQLWARILTAVPNSRLLMHTLPGRHRISIRQRFADTGVAPDRIEFIPIQQRHPYMNTYHRIDIALDPFPYGGGVTTCDALYMGVPVVTLRGQPRGSRRYHHPQQSRHPRSHRRDARRISANCGPIGR